MSPWWPPYLGLSTIVERKHPEAGVNLSYIGTGPGDAGDRYTGLDRFGRVVDQRWSKGGADVERFAYGYDADGNVLYRDNKVNSAFSELYHANGGAAPSQ